MSTRKTQRQGTATVELAVCLPLLVLLILGGMEAANAIFLKQGLTVAAYETAKMATTIGYTSTEATSRGQEVLDARGFSNAVINISPAVTPTTPPGTPITVSVTDAVDANSISPLVFLSASDTVQAQVTMVRN